MRLSGEEKKAKSCSALSLATAFLAKKDRTEEEVRKRLQKKQIAKKDIDKTISYLKQYGYIDDAAFCRNWIRIRQKTRPVGSAYIIKKLRSLGVSNVVIEDVLSRHLSDDDQIQAAVHALAKNNCQKRYDAKNDKARSFRFLLSRGFPRYIAYDALQRIEHDNSHYS